MVCKVGKVDRCGLLLKKFCAFYRYLCVILFIFTGYQSTGGGAELLELVDAVALVRLILLRQNDLIEADRMVLGLGEELLVEKGDVPVRYFNRTKLL